MTLHGPAESRTELVPICMCFMPALFVTSLPHSVHRRELPQSVQMIIRDNDMVSDLPRVALPSSSEGRGCPVPPDAVGYPGLVRVLFIFNGMRE